MPSVRKPRASTKRGGGGTSASRDSHHLSLLNAKLSTASGDSYAKRFQLCETKTSHKRSLGDSMVKIDPSGKLLRLDIKQIVMNGSTSSIVNCIDARIDPPLRTGTAFDKSKDMTPSILGEEMTHFTMVFERCPWCKHTKPDQVSAQTRSIDEMPTTFYTCTNPKCKKHWRS